MQQVHPYPIGCDVSPSVPAETLVADGWTTFLLFFAVSEKIDPATGYLKDLGIAVLEFLGCDAIRFGSPNDEGRPEHRLSAFGLSGLIACVGNVQDSEWVLELKSEKLASARRTWQPRGQDPVWLHNWNPRHFIVPLKEKTLECIADEARVVKFAATFNEAYEYVRSRQAEH